MLRIFFLFALTQQAFAWDCKSTIVMFPVPISDPVLSQKIVENIALRLIDSQKLKCNPFLETSESNGTVDILGVSTYFTISPPKLSKKQIGILKEDLSATHIMYVKRVKNTDLEYVAEIYKMTSNNRVELVQQKQFTIERSLYEKYRTSTLPRFFAKFAPNNIATGFTSTNISLSPIDKYEESETKNKGIMPPLISSISLTKIEHRRGFDLLDVSGTIFPGVFLFAIDQDSTLKLKNPNDATTDSPLEKIIHVEAYGFCSNINAEGSLYLPIGTIFGSIGFGPCLLQLKREDSGGVFYLSVATRLLVGYRVFLTDHFNLFFSVDQLLFNQRLYASEYADSSQITRGTFGLGYFITNPENLFMKAWNTVF